MSYCKIGEIFTHEGVKLKVVEGEGCRGCYFENVEDCPRIHCDPDIRFDKKSVIFIKQEDSRMLKIRLEERERALIMTVLEQDKVGFEEFTASNSFRVDSEHGPELCEKVVFLRGSNSSDNLVPIIKYFSSNEKRDKYKQRLLQALREFTGTTQPEDEIYTF